MVGKALNTNQKMSVRLDSGIISLYDFRIDRRYVWTQ